jgi:T5orf172 domain-containing protein
MRPRHATAVTPRAAHVYLAQTTMPNGKSATKIGSTTDLQQRARSLKSPWGGAVHVIDAAHVGYGTAGEALAFSIEYGLHARFDAQRIAVARGPYQHTEWFRLRGADLAAFHGIVATMKQQAS